MLAWRSAFAAFSLALLVIVQNRRDPLWGVRAIGWPGLIGLLDVVLGRFWVWLVFKEQPGQAAIIGGALSRWSF
jgi:hypothetical protein